MENIPIEIMQQMLLNSFIINKQQIWIIYYLLKRYKSLLVSGFANFRKSMKLYEDIQAFGEKVTCFNAIKTVLIDILKWFFYNLSWLSWLFFALKPKEWNMIMLNHIYNSKCLNINCNDKIVCILITNVIIHVRYKSGDFMAYMYYATEKYIHI